MGKKVQCFIWDLLNKGVEDHVFIIVLLAIILFWVQDDKDLQNLRFNYVPKKMNEHEFWKYYFMAVDRVKQSVSQEDTSADTDCNIDQDQAEFEVSVFEFCSLLC